MSTFIGPQAPARQTLTLTGVNEVIAKLNQKIQGISFASRRGLIAAGLTIQRKAQERCPVDTGNLRASAFTVWKGKPPAGNKSWKGSAKEQAAAEASHQKVTALVQSEIPLDAMASPEVAVGFSAAYALYVHENTGASHVKKDKQGGDVQVGEAKFLENAIRENEGLIVQAVRQEAVMK